MLSVAEALAAVLAEAAPKRPVVLPLEQAAGCVLAESVTAPADLPPFPKALVDGYALRTLDLDQTGPPYRLRIGETITAGMAPSRPLAADESALVMTGAPLPEGTDAVVMHEQTRRPDATHVEIQTAVTPGQNLLPRGREVERGALLLPSGHMLNPASRAVLASLGIQTVLVHPRPRISIIATGDELVDFRTPEPGPGKIRESNTLMLADLAGAQAAELLARDWAPDHPVALRQVLGDPARALGGPGGMGADILVICGGVSAGTHDLVPGTLEELGVRKRFHKIRLKPGKPLWFGVGPERAGSATTQQPLPGTLVFGLPGNPVSSLVGFLLFVIPAIRVLRGLPPSGPTLRAAPLNGPFKHRGDRPTYHPAAWLCPPSGPRIQPLDWAGSADLRSVALADGLALFEPGEPSYEAGQIVQFLPFDEFFRNGSNALGPMAVDQGR